MWSIKIFIFCVLLTHTYIISAQRIPVVSPVLNDVPTQPATTSTTTTTTQLPVVVVTNSNGSEIQLQLQACCGSSCVSFDNLMSMVGVQCCGETAVNFFDKICCSDTKFYDRRSGSKYYDRCCDDKPYSYDQTCCKGKVYDGAGQSCCGDTPYHTYDRTMICCADKLHRVPENSSSPACCGSSVYDAWGKTQFCCGGKVYRRIDNHACCVKHETGDSTIPSEAEGYKPEQQLCCNGVHDLKTYDTCCYVSDTKLKEWTPPKPIPYDSATQCCDLDGVKKYNNTAGTCG